MIDLNDLALDLTLWLPGNVIATILYLISILEFPGPVVSRPKGRSMSIKDEQVTSNEYDFTAADDWFSHNIDIWKSLTHHVQSASPRALEIGSWEGRSAVFLLTNLCKAAGEVVCIDHFDMLDTPGGCARFDRINRNLTLAGGKFRVLDEFSVPGLMMLLEEEMLSETPGFDWIYIDGSHEASDTLLDGELVWRLARKGSIVIFDDYVCPVISKPSRS